MNLALKAIYKAVTTAGTEVQLTTTRTNAYGGVIKAVPGNTGNVVVGYGSGTSMTNGYVLDAGEEVKLADLFPKNGDASDNLDLSLVWVDSATNGDAVCVVYSERV